MSAPWGPDNQTSNILTKLRPGRPWRIAGAARLHVCTSRVEIQANVDLDSVTRRVLDERQADARLGIDARGDARQRFGAALWKRGDYTLTELRRAARRHPAQSERHSDGGA